MRLIIGKEILGISEVMGAKNFKIKQGSVILRGISGERGDTLIINLLGNPKGAIESISVVSGIIPHCINTIQGKGGH